MRKLCTEHQHALIQVTHTLNYVTSDCFLTENKGNIENRCFITENEANSFHSVSQLNGSFLKYFSSQIGGQGFHQK
jgi:hypothetical protein